VDEARWLEVSMTLNSEMAEAVAEVMARFVANGVVVESGVVYNDAEDEGTPVEPVRVYGYLPIDAGLEEKRQRLTEALWHLGQIQELPSPTYRTIADEDWMAVWKQHYHPIQIGERLLILPAWMEQTPPERVAVRIDPSMAFGTGTHPTTQLCLQMLEKHLNPGEDIIDVGCGSGILSIAALKLGARHALAVDIDELAIRSTLENAATNEVADRLECGTGSVTEIIQGQFSIANAPVVLANILAPVILRLFEAGLTQLVASGGRLILSGILDEQVPDVEVVAARHGLTLNEKRNMEDWVVLVYCWERQSPDSL
jgi:ribosomal protein L11 methyltransferase